MLKICKQSKPLCLPLNARSSPLIQVLKRDSYSWSPCSAVLLAALLVPLALVALIATPCSAEERDGAQLYRKHCSLCHADASRLRSEELMNDIRMPPPGMPAFGDDKLSDEDVQAIADFVRFGAPFVAQPASQDTASLPLRSDVTESALTPVVHMSERPAAHEDQRTRRKKPKAKSTWNVAFARTWTIKGQQEGREVTFQQFTIASSPTNEPEVELARKYSDYTVKVSSFQLVGRSLKLELTWGWKLNAKYWKIETMDLRLSGDGKKLTGTYGLRTSSGQDITSSVWGE